jgi:putative ABC transport system substrate-binding protein
LPELAAELVQLKEDVIVAQNTVVGRALAAATRTIPVVNAGGGDLVASRLAASLARTGGNVTGLTSLTVDLNVKRLELLKEILPRLIRVAVLPSPANLASGQALKEMQAAASSLKMELQILKVNVADDLPGAFDAATKGRTEAVIGMPDATGIFLANMKQISTQAVKKKMPTMFPSSHYVEFGALLSYAANDAALWYRAATYVDKILKGAKPADLPVEQPTKFELVINLKTAKQIGLTIPPNVLARADRVIR